MWFKPTWFIGNKRKTQWHSSSGKEELNDSLQDYHFQSRLPSPIPTAKVANCCLPLVTALTLSSLPRLAGSPIVQTVFLGSMGDFSWSDPNSVIGSVQQPPCSCSAPLVLLSIGHCSAPELLNTSPTHASKVSDVVQSRIKALSKPSAYKRNTFLVKCNSLPHFYLLFIFFWLFLEAICGGQGDPLTLGMFACSLSNMNANIISISTVKLHSLFLNRKFINCYITDMQQSPGPSS